MAKFLFTFNVSGVREGVNIFNVTDKRHAARVAKAYLKNERHVPEQEFKLSSPKLEEVEI